MSVCHRFGEFFVLGGFLFGVELVYLGLQFFGLVLLRCVCVCVCVLKVGREGEGMKAV